MCTILLGNRRQQDGLDVIRAFAFDCGGANDDVSDKLVGDS